LHDAVLAFTDRYLALERVLGQDVEHALIHSVRFLRKFVESPTYGQSVALAGKSMSEHQVERDFKKLIRRVAIRDVLLGRPRYGLWMAGSFRFSKMFWVYRLRRLLDR
jgi:hypothetical protein